MLKEEVQEIIAIIDHYIDVSDTIASCLCDYKDRMAMYELGNLHESLCAWRNEFDEKLK